MFKSKNIITKYRISNIERKLNKMTKSILLIHQNIRNIRNKEIGDLIQKIEKYHQAGANIEIGLVEIATNKGYIEHWGFWYIEYYRINKRYEGIKKYLEKEYQVTPHHKNIKEIIKDMIKEVEDHPTFDKLRDIVIAERREVPVKNNGDLIQIQKLEESIQQEGGNISLYWYHKNNSQWYSCDFEIKHWNLYINGNSGLSMEDAIKKLFKNIAENPRIKAGSGFLLNH